MAQVQIFKRQGMWENIVKLFQAEDNFNTELPIAQLAELGYAYSRRASNLLEKNFKIALHNYLLAEKLFLQLIQDKRTEEKQRSQYIKTLAYIYYTVYTNANIWSATFRKEQYDEEVYALVRKYAFRKEYLGNKALLAYRQALLDDGKHIKTLYRAGQLLSKMQLIVTFSKAKWENYDFAAGTDDLKKALAVDEDDYRNFIVKLNLKYFDTMQIKYFEQAIEIYRECDTKLQKTWFNEYIKALYNSCVYYIKKVESFYKSEQNWIGSLDYWACKPERAVVQPWYRDAFGKKEVVRQRLAEILHREGISCKDVEQQITEIAEKDVPEQANFVYYRIADYIRVYKIARNENVEANIKQCLQFYYYSVLVDFCITTDEKHNKVHFKEPYLKLGILLAMLDMHDELHNFKRKFRLKSADYDYLRVVGDVCAKVHEGDFVQAEKRIIDLQQMRLNKMNQKVVEQLKQRLKNYMNNPESVEQARQRKNIAILLRNALSELNAIYGR